MSWQTTYVDDLAVLEELIDTGNAWETVKVALFTAGPTINKNMVLADFTLATFTGATPIAVTWGTPYAGDDGAPQVDSQLLTFIRTGGVISETILGYVVTDTGGTVVKAAEVFDDPVQFDAVGVGFAFAIALRRYDGFSRRL